jgi:3-methyladenine DNA glycosylase/8-oxoguanine DNA glycosylase
MWFDEQKTAADWRRARVHLCKGDPAMRRIVRRVGACTLAPRPRREYFVTLCKSIYTQQISTRIATILCRGPPPCHPRRCPNPHHSRCIAKSRGP